MEFLSELPSPTAKFFALFFSGSFVLLLLILAIGIVGRVASLRKAFRQMSARRARKSRMLADPERLRTEALQLEGVYYFGEEARMSGDAGEHSRDTHAA